MPNGGVHHCGNCRWFNNDSFCSLRQQEILIPHWTTCQNCNLDVGKTDGAIGPIYAIVCEVKNGKGGYHQIPYYKGIRVDTDSVDDDDDTYLAFTDPDGVERWFDCVADYLDFYYSPEVE